ncbi:MAG: Lrp/AsnC family transcriptional regulator [archaeon]
MQMDDINQKILNALLENSRLSYRQIAKNTGISAATVMNRIKSLEEEGVIKGYSTLIDYDKLGFEFNVIIEVRVSHGNLAEVEKKLSADYNVVAVYDATGDFDVTLIGRFKNRKQLDAYVKKIQTFPNIERTSTRLILKTIKEEPLKL